MFYKPHPGPLQKEREKRKMNINRNNYEEFLLLYADNELSFNERQAAEDFLEANPDLKTELQMLLDSKLHTEHIPFFNKTALYKNDSFITEENYESYFLLYADDELTEEQKKETEKYAASSPTLQKEFELILATRLKAENNIVLADKSALYRKEEPARILRISWMRIAAAAVVIGIILSAGILLLNRKTVSKEPELVKKESAPAQNNAGTKETAPSANESPADDNSSEKNTVADNVGEKNEIKIDDKKPNKEPIISQKSLQQNIATIKSTVKENKKQDAIVTNNNDASYELVKNGVNTELKKVTEATEAVKMVAQPEAVVKADKPKEIVDIAVGPEEINKYAKTTLNTEEENNTSIGVFNVSEDKVQKSGLRGLFRKVKRVISRRNSGDDGEEQATKKIRIGSFAIARGN